MNPYDEWSGHRGYKNTATLSANFTGTLSNVSVDIAIAHDGWYAISADEDFYWAGPSASAPTATATCRHQWAKDTPVVRCAAGQNISLIRVSTSGNYYVNKIRD